MVIESGLFNNMVLQRTKKNLSDARICGTCVAQGTVHATVKQGQRTLNGFAGVRIGRAAAGKFQARLRGLPAGGPYAILLEIPGRGDSKPEQLQVRNVLVGDVWILAGQSNMEGIGHIRHALKPDTRVRAFYMNDVWATAKDPMHVFADAVDRVHHDICGGRGSRPMPHIGVGPGMAFAHEMRRITGVPQGLIACAHGGTSMSQWDPSRNQGEQSSLYGAMLRRYVKNGSAAAGVFWYQGCSDADETAAAKYTDRMSGLIAAIRTDFRTPSLPVVMVQIARVCGELTDQKGWNSVQDRQRLLPGSVRRLAVVPAIDLDLDDGIHIAGYDQNRLGRRSARAMAVLCGQDTKTPPPIRVESVRIKRDPLDGNAMIVVKCGNVCGKLRSPGRPEGFSLTPEHGHLRHALIYRTELHQDTVILKTTIPPAEALSMYLHYGFGKHPYCNITDTADRSLPVMGPVYLGGDTVYGPFITALDVSSFIPSAGKLRALAYPENHRSLGFAPRTFTTTFCNLHTEITQSPVDDPLVYFRAHFSCAEPMTAMIDLGYDGPVKVWIDKTEHLSDPDGINPALPGDALIPVHLDRGGHEVMVALGSNGKKAWGIFLRVGRTALKPGLITQGPQAYMMPVQT